MTPKEHRKKWKWEAYKPGDVITDAGIHVLSEPIELGPEMRNTHYDVSFRCCGKVSRTSHETIRERERKKSTRCRACGYKRTAEVRRIAREQALLPVEEQQQQAPDYGVTQLTQQPLHVDPGPYIDCDAGAQPGLGVDWMAGFSPAMGEALRSAHNTTHRVRPNAQQEER